MCARNFNEAAFSWPSAPCAAQPRFTDSNQTLIEHAILSDEIRIYRAALVTSERALELLGAHALRSVSVDADAPVVFHHRDFEAEARRILTPQQNAHRHVRCATTVLAHSCCVCV